MKTIGIIAEFNPFHHGHKYLIDEAKRITQADFCICIMSGNFVQRGAPALLDKYVRTRMALLNGIDLVVELPVYYATGSAEYFSRGAVRLLDKLGVVDFLCFGSECGDIGILKSSAKKLSDENPAFQKALQANLKKGLSFPNARSQSIESLLLFTANAAHSSIELPTIINEPNNILGIEYLKALDFFDSKIVPVTIKRHGLGYHDEQTASATAIRKLLTGVKPGDKPDNLPELSKAVPKNTLPFYENQEKNKITKLYDIDTFSELLYYKLTLNSDSGYTHFFDVSSDLSDKIRKNLFHFYGYEDFIHTLKSKDLTYMRISRCLNHILLDIYDTDVTLFMENDYVFYARMLGFKENAGALLKKIKKCSSIPLLSKLADAEKLLDGIGMKMLKKDIQAAHIYNRDINEYTAPIVKH
ncbi:MAG: nucleotidyltransferase [Lachnospiraceae bacterium]|nr:nucleotidyltransferase [Lachnospiraceae bacterium]